MLASQFYNIYISYIPFSLKFFHVSGKILYFHEKNTSKRGKHVTNGNAYNKVMQNMFAKLCCKYCLNSP